MKRVAGVVGEGAQVQRSLSWLMLTNPIGNQCHENCEECLKTGSRWLAAMPDVRPRYCDGSLNRHATKHFRATGHPIIEGYDPPEGWGWCYIDEVFWPYPTAPRLSSVQFHGITGGMPSTGKTSITRKAPLIVSRLSFPACYCERNKACCGDIGFGAGAEGVTGPKFCTSRSSSPRQTRFKQAEGAPTMVSSDTRVLAGVPGRVGGAGSAIADMFLDKLCSFVPLLPHHDRAASIETGDVERVPAISMPIVALVAINLLDMTGAPFDPPPIPASLAGEAGARPDHSIRRR